MSYLAKENLIDKLIFVLVLLNLDMQFLWLLYFKTFCIQVF